MQERIMYNDIYKYLQENKTLYPKKFSFQFGHSTDHAIIQFVDQIFEALENNLNARRVFIDLSKAFDTVDHTMLLKKLEPQMDKQLSFKQETISLELVNYGVPQGSILAPLIFLLYLIDLKNA